MRSTTPHSLALYLLLSVSSLDFGTASPAQAYAWPAGVDPSVKYWPLGEGPPSKRWLQEFTESSALNQSSPKCSGVGKMSSEDPSEKFYWDWEHLARSQQGFLGLDTFVEENLENALAELPANVYRAPHRDIVSDNGIIGVLLGKRQTFECAVGTQSCSAIGVPGSCCDLTETCSRIPDIGFGNVGCCPKGQTCTGNLSGCGIDKKTCSSSQGGGCCTPGYDCSPNGCILPKGNPVTASTCSSGFYSCPTNVAGGCCPSGRLCGISDCPSATITGTGAVATPGDTCPTGYYTCAAQYNGGCCRIGRDCAITDCPERVITISNGSAGAGGIVTTALGGCAIGWQMCGAGRGGGCCPNGYQCGATNCPAVTVGASSYVLSGQTFTTNVVLPATGKTQPTALAGIPIPSGNALRKSGKVTQVVVVVAVVVGVVANA